MTLPGVTPHLKQGGSLQAMGDTSQKFISSVVPCTDNNAGTFNWSVLNHKENVAYYQLPSCLGI